MTSRKALINIALLAIVIVALDSVGQFLRLYYTLWWFDVFMHLLGGAWVGHLLLSLSRFAPPQIRRWLPADKRWFYYSAILVVGIGWEVYEVIVGWVVTPEPYPVDTSIDIIMDLLGAWSVRKSYKNKHLHGNLS